MRTYDSRKRPAAVTDTFFASPGCSLTRDSTAENTYLGFKAEENDNVIDNDDDDNYIEMTKSLITEAQYDFLYCFPPSNHHIIKLQNSNGLFFFSQQHKRHMINMTIRPQLFKRWKTLSTG